MSTSISSKVLAIAKTQEAERLRKVKERFQVFMEEQFQTLLEISSPWIATQTDAGTTYKYGKTITQDDVIDLKKGTDCLGFIITHIGVSQFDVSIPWPPTNQKKMTPAQLMFRKHSIDLRKQADQDRKSAREICSEVLNLLKAGKFTTYHISSTLTANVKISSITSTSEAFEAEVHKIMTRRRFPNVTIHKDCWHIRLN